MVPEKASVQVPVTVLRCHSSAKVPEKASVVEVDNAPDCSMEPTAVDLIALVAASAPLTLPESVGGSQIKQQDTSGVVNASSDKVAADAAELPSPSGDGKLQGKNSHTRSKAKSSPRSKAKMEVQKTDLHAIYDGSFSHPVFGRKKIDISVEFTTGTTGTWTALDNKSRRIRITWHGERVTLDDGMTQFVGVRNLKGNIQGQVIQEAERGGSFSLKQRKAATQDSTDKENSCHTREFTESSL
jgi:hypothetical protein